MRSLKLMVAMAVLAAFVAGPVLAQTEAPATGSTSTSSDQGTTKSTTKGKHHVRKKHKKSTSGSSGAMDSTTTK